MEKYTKYEKTDALKETQVFSAFKNVLRKIPPHNPRKKRTWVVLEFMYSRITWLLEKTLSFNDILVLIVKLKETQGFVFVFIFY